MIFRDRRITTAPKVTKELYLSQNKTSQESLKTKNESYKNDGNMEPKTTLQ